MGKDHHFVYQWFSELTLTSYQSFIQGGENS